MDEFEFDIQSPRSAVLKISVTMQDFVQVPEWPTERCVSGEYEIAVAPWVNATAGFYDVYGRLIDLLEECSHVLQSESEVTDKTAGFPYGLEVRVRDAD